MPPYGGGWTVSAGEAAGYDENRIVAVLVSNTSLIYFLAPQGLLKTRAEFHTHDVIHSFTAVGIASFARLHVATNVPCES